MADNGVDSGNVVQCNTEALSDLCILDPSQMVIQFNAMVTFFLMFTTVHILQNIITTVMIYGYFSFQSPLFLRLN